MSMKRSRASSGRGSSAGEAGPSGSASKRAAPEKSWDDLVGGQPDTAFQTYSLKLKYGAGDLIVHSKFGKGAVLSADDTSIEVLVADGKKKLAHGRI